MPSRNAGSMITSLIASLILVAMATTLVLPGRQTPAVVKAFFDGLANAMRAALGLQ